MKSIILKSVLFVALAAGVLSGCVNSDDYDAPNLDCVDPNLTANKTVQDIIAQATTVPTLYANDDIIEAYVTSSDEKGNIYKSISFQTIPADNSAPVGFSVPINLNSTYGKGFYPGRKVYIKLKGLYTAIVYNSLQIGGLYKSSPTAAEEIGRISETEWQKYLFLSCSEVSEDTFARPMSVAQAFTNANLNTLIDLQGVRFVDASLGRTYFDVDSGGGSTNHYVIQTTGGTSQIVRFSSFAPFSGKMIPAGSGTIRGVLTKYNSDFQFMVRYESDIRLTEPRSFTFSGNFTENFESYVSNQNNFPNYFNDPVLGSKVWVIKTTASKYIEMTSFSSAEKNRTLFFVPVDFTAASNFTFQYKVSFLSNGHVPLKVYYTKNYVPGVGNPTLVNITSEFSNLVTQSAANFTSAGTYAIPESLTGNGFFVFEYSGSASNPTYTTNLGIDNIVVN